MNAPVPAPVPPQGYHLGRPMSAEALEAWLAAASGRALGSRAGALRGD